MVKKGMLVAGGILNFLFGVLHVFMARSIHVSKVFTDDTRSLLTAFNSAVTLVVFYFAYVSLFQSRDLLGTKIGKSTLVLISVFYLVRAAEEFFLFRFDALIFFACILPGGIYAILLFMSDQNASTVDSQTKF